MEVAVDIRQQVSYLRARDPSIITGYVRLNHLKVDLANTRFQVQEEPSTLLEEEPELLQVYLRIKKTEQLTSLYKFDEQEITCNIPEHMPSTSNCITAKRYKFDKIFGPKATQAELFNSVLKPKLFHFINGRTSSILAYGASGSGKTFTIFGTEKEPGILPRAFEYLFRTLSHVPENVTFKPDCSGSVIFLNSSACEEETNNRKQLLQYFNSTIDKQHIRTYRLMQERLSIEPVGTVDHHSDIAFGVWISFAEIYNENVYDLLKPAQLKGKPRNKLAFGSSNNQIYIKNLTSINVTNGLEAYQILQYGLLNLKYAETSVNSHSSRSHSIFTIKLVQGSKKKNDFIVSYFHFSDLAGSERVKKTLNVGARLKESNNINTSLFVLGKCIKLLRESQKNNQIKLIPFRESKFTQLFQRALLGFEDIALIINITPETAMIDETQHALNFSAVAKAVQLPMKDEKKLMKIPNEAQNRHVQMLKDAVEKLRVQLKEQEIRHQAEEKRIYEDTVKMFQEANAENARSRVDFLKQVDNLCKEQYLSKIAEAREYFNNKSHKKSAKSLEKKSDKLHLKREAQKAEINRLNEILNLQKNKIKKLMSNSDNIQKECHLSEEQYINDTDEDESHSSIKKNLSVIICDSSDDEVIGNIDDQNECQLN